MAKVNQEGIEKYLDTKKDIQPLVRSSISTLMANTGIGQKTVLEKNKANTDNMIKALELAGKHKDKKALITELEKVIKGSNWTGSSSLGFFSAQLKEDQRQVLIALLKDKTNSQALLDTVDHILKNYVYTS